MNGQGFTWRGPWTATASYSAYDVVSCAGASWVAAAPSTNDLPGLDGAWTTQAGIPAVLQSAACTTTSVTCTALLIVNEVYATGGFAGAADPSVRADPLTGTL